MIRFTKSLSAKLFYLMTALVLAVVIGMSLQSSSKLRDYLTRSFQDNALQTAERTASDVSAVIESFVTKVSVVLPKLDLSPTAKNSSDVFVNLLKNDREIVAASVFVVEKSISKEIMRVESSEKDSRYGSAAVAQTQAKLLQEAKSFVSSIAEAPASRENVSIRNVAPATGLPLLQLAVKFQVDGISGKSLYVVISTWNTKVQLSLARSRFTNITMVDGAGDIFASANFTEVRKAANIKRSPLVSQALKSKVPTGFQSLYRDHRGEERIGAYAQLAKYSDLFVIVERDANAALLVIKKSYVSASLWAGLFILLAMLVSFVSAKSVTKSLRDLVAVTQEIASGNFQVRLQPKSSDEIAVLGYSVNHMAAKITDLMSAQVAQARYEKELETARMVQSTFFPKQDVINGPLSVTGFYQPATECGGDLWGHFQVDTHRQLLFVADAMGHGAPAALVTAIGYATCQAVATLLQDEQHIDPSPARLLDRLNRIIFEAVEGKISMTFFIALFDFQEGVITFSNAGHNFPLILTNDREDTRLSPQAKAKWDKDTGSSSISMTLQGVPLGVERDAQFKEKQIDIKAGDRIVMFTDGLIENHLPGQLPMERKRLVNILSKCGQNSCHEIKDILVTEATNLFGVKDLADDVTIVVAEIDRNWSRVRAPLPLPSMKVFAS